MICWLCTFEMQAVTSYPETHCSTMTQSYLISPGPSKLSCVCFYICVWILKTFHILYSFCFFPWHMSLSLNDHPGKMTLHFMKLCPWGFVFLCASFSGYLLSRNSIRLAHISKCESLLCWVKLSCCPPSCPEEEELWSTWPLSYKTDFDLARCVFYLINYAVIIFFFQVKSSLHKC